MRATTAGRSPVKVPSTYMLFLNLSSTFDTINIIIKLIFTCIILISTPFIANSINSMGVNGFISGIGTILIVYFIISVIWLFLE